MLKVDICVDALGPKMSGIGRYTWELASRLPSTEIDSLRFFRNDCWIENPRSLVSGGPVLTKEKPLMLGFFSFPKWLGRYQLLHECRDAIFHGPNYFLPECVSSAVATIHDLSIFKYPDAHPADRVLKFERDFSASIKRAKHLITDSEATRREVIDFLAWPAELITTVSLGVAAQFRPVTYEKLKSCLHQYGLSPGKYALCVSTLEPRKQIGKLLESYARVPLKVRLLYPLVLIGGAGWLSDDIHEKIKNLLAEGWLHYLGFVVESHLPSIYSGARAFVYPSIYEGFGLPVMEAMASGVPVVTSNKSCLPEISGGAALLVDTDDIEALATAIEIALLDETWRIKAIIGGLQNAKTFTWERCIKETVDVYKKMVTIK